MESRRVIYYGGNSIKPRKVSMPSIYKRMRQQGVGVAENTNHMPPFAVKNYAMKNCMWCPADFDDFRIVCNQCHNCQFCGMVAQSERKCQLCGNEMPPELVPSENNHKHKIRFF